MNKLLLKIAILGMLASAAQADSSGTIFRIVCHDNSISPICHVAMNGTPNVSSCSTSGWHYSFIGTTDEGKNLLSILLAAQLSKQNVTLGGKGTCDVAAASEDLRHVYISTP